MVEVTQTLSKYNKRGVGRVYRIREGVEYPSVTTIVNQTKDLQSMEGLNKWKDSVGLDVSKWIANESMRMGTKVHEMIESYLMYGTTKFPGYPLLANAHFENMKEYLDKIKAQHTEVNVFSDELKIAGTCDCMGTYEDIPSIIDFKTASKAVEDYLHDYLIQATAYTIMVEERMQFRASQIVIIMSGRNNTKNVWVKDPIDYVDELKARITKYYQMHPDSF